MISDSTHHTKISLRNNLTRKVILRAIYVKFKIIVTNVKRTDPSWN